MGCCTTASACIPSAWARSRGLAATTAAARASCCTRAWTARTAPTGLSVMTAPTVMTAVTAAARAAVHGGRTTVSPNPNPNPNPNPYPDPRTLALTLTVTLARLRRLRDGHRRNLRRLRRRTLRRRRSQRAQPTETHRVGGRRQDWCHLRLARYPAIARAARGDASGSISDASGSGPRDDLRLEIARAKGRSRAEGRP